MAVSNQKVLCVQPSRLNVYASIMRKVFRTLAFAVLALIAVVTVSPPALRPGAGNAILERWAAFALFGVLLGLGYPKGSWRAGIFALTMTVVLEAVQELVPNRHGRIEDALIKSCGAIMGLGLAAAVQSLLAPKRKTTTEQ